MLLYSSNFELLGMSKRILNLIGYPSFGSFIASNNDISDLFTESSKSYRDDVHYIKTILGNGKPLDVSLRDGKDNIIKLEIRAQELNGDDWYYLVAIQPEDKKESPAFQKPQLVESKNKSLNNVFLKSYISEIQKIEKDKFQRNTQKESVDMEWFLYTLKELDIDQGSFIFALENFIEYSNTHSELLQEALVVGDVSTYSPILAKLKDSSDSLKISPVTRILYRFENSEILENSANFREYQDIILKLEKLIKKRKAS